MLPPPGLPGSNRPISGDFWPILTHFWPVFGYFGHNLHPGGGPSEGTHFERAKLPRRLPTSVANAGNRRFLGYFGAFRGIPGLGPSMGEFINDRAEMSVLAVFRPIDGLRTFSGSVNAPLMAFLFTPTPPYNAGCSTLHFRSFPRRFEARESPPGILPL